MSKKNSRGRIRVFFAEVEGDDETIQEGLQAINVAAHKIFQEPKKVIQYIPNPEVVGNEALVEIADSLESEELDEINNTRKQSQQKSTSSRSKPPTMSIVKNLDLHPEGKIAFKDFFSTKNPRNNYQAIAVSTYYLDRILELANITPNHIFTCFKEVSRRTPANMPQSIRDTSSKKGWIQTEKGKVEITNIGENIVEHELPEKGD